MSSQNDLKSGSAARVRAFVDVVRARQCFRQGLILTTLGVLIAVLSFISPNIPVLSTAAGTGGLLVGLVLIAAGIAVLSASGYRYVVWFRAFRRTRPFWGGTLLVLGGWLVLRLSMVSAHIVVVSGITGVGGWLTGGGMVLCGLAAWSAPSQRYVVGVVGVLLAVISLIVSNLGGLFVGMVAGILGGAMTLAWGPKGAPRARGSRLFRLGALGLAPRVAAVQPSPRPRPRPAPSPMSAAGRPDARTRA